MFVEQSESHKLLICITVCHMMQSLYFRVEDLKSSIANNAFCMHIKGQFTYILPAHGKSYVK